MGNSKDNVHVFHDITNSKACCVEVTDNQDVNHWMTVEINKVDKNYHEFRYREADFGNYPKGLVYGLQIMESWLYDDDKPFIDV